MILEARESAAPLDVLPSSGRSTLVKKELMVKSHNGSFRADFVSPYTLQQTQPKESKAFMFWVLVVVLLILALVNMILTFTILSVLRLGQGMQSLELIPSDNLIKFYGLTDLCNITKRDGHLEGFQDSPVSLTADNSEAVVNILKHKGAKTWTTSKIVVRPDGLAEITNVSTFEVKDHEGRLVFSSAYPNFELPKGVKKLDVQIARVSRISSPVDSNLLVGSDTYVKLRGNEGTKIEGKEIVWSADQDLLLRSLNGSIHLMGGHGVVLDVQNMPLVTNEGSTQQFKLCVCREKGRLFRVKMPATCLSYAGANNPCA
ncbi:beta-sarcoglycan [Cloeon dipterum]|uniref:Beta-sarcoglycan n=1 Tax=Cloeon dipterum TaxID=197152 RepID=A0A8S1CQX5_9INSE|nr:Hypothetical predicted protein [Cloeon dipterum]